MTRSMPFVGALCAVVFAACGAGDPSTEEPCSVASACMPVTKGPPAGTAALSITSARRVVDLDGRRSPAGAYALIEITLANRGVAGMLSPAPASFVARMADRTVRRPARVELSAEGTACSGSILVEDGVSTRCLLAFEIPKTDWPVQLDFETPTVAALAGFGAAPALEQGGLTCVEILDCRAGCDTHACEDACLQKGSSDGAARYAGREHCLDKACGVHRAEAATESEPCAYDAADRTWLPAACDACRAAALDDGGACATEAHACDKSR